MTQRQTLLPHEKDLGGGFRVRRLLPAAARQAVGPFLFFDHFGPAEAGPDDNHDVRPHPHIGLATATYLFEGAMQHHDSTGAAQRIEPGAINWMTAGRGIAHSERAPEDLRGTAYALHGLQFWAALPQALEETEPGFSHTPSSAIPQRRVGEATVRVLIGQALGERSPVPTLMETLVLDILLPPGESIDIGPWAPEMALYAPQLAFDLMSSDLTAQTVPARQLAVLAGAVRLRAHAKAAEPTRVMLIGGAALDAPRFIWWNFVSSRKERIEQAAQDWQAGRFATVPGETEFIPLPPMPRLARPR